jgi:hypothetical protein
VLTHNGVVSNDDDLFRDLGVKRAGEVDSEAIAALLAYGGDEPWRLLERVDCDAALAWLNADEPGVLHLARVVGRPLHVAKTKGGALVYASTATAIRQACEAARVRLDGAPRAVPEGTYLRVEGGRVVRQEKFRPLRKPTPKVPAAWKGGTFRGGSGSGGWYAPPGEPVLSQWRRDQLDADAMLRRAMQKDDAEAAERQARETRARWESMGQPKPETKAERKARRAQERRDRFRREAERDALAMLDARAPERAEARPPSARPPATTPQRGAEGPVSEAPRRKPSLLATWDKMHGWQD